MFPTFPHAKSPINNEPENVVYGSMPYSAARVLALAMMIVAAGSFSVLAQTTVQTPSDSGDPIPQRASITGSVVDQDGAVIANASITLTQPQGAPQRTTSASDGTFAFSNVNPGPFELSVEAATFATRKISGDLRPGQPYWAPPIQLSAAAKIEVEVAETQEQIAEEEMHVEEKQRIFGVFPNFYVTYDPDPAPLNTRQKYQLAWKSVIDPVGIGISGFLAGLEQADNTYPGYGQGAQGYAKRFGATYADFVSGTFIGSAILPAVFKQDPRYIYKGTGSRKSRLLYALASSVICRGDNRRWQPNYSNVLGDFASGALSNVYYPASSRGVGLTIENTLIGIGGGSLGAVVEEFFLRKLTPHANDAHPPQN
jgi:hypothetical protein